VTCESQSTQAGKWEM